MANVHHGNKTPAVSISVISLIFSLIPIILIAFNNKISDVYGWLGTVATFGFLFNYVLVTIATPIYLHKEKQLKIKDIIVSLVTFGILLIPIIGSIYPVPSYPYNLFPFIFLGWLAIGAIWFTVQKSKNPNLIANIQSDVNGINEQFKMDIKSSKVV